MRKIRKNSPADRWNSQVPLQTWLQGWRQGLDSPMVLGWKLLRLLNIMKWCLIRLCWHLATIKIYQEGSRRGLFFLFPSCVMNVDTDPVKSQKDTPIWHHDSSLDQSEYAYWESLKEVFASSRSNGLNVSLLSLLVDSFLLLVENMLHGIDLWSLNGKCIRINEPGWYNAAIAGIIWNHSRLHHEF